jgi:hypothetical protein
MEPVVSAKAAADDAARLAWAGVAGAASNPDAVLGVGTLVAVAGAHRKNTAAKPTRTAPKPRPPTITARMAYPFGQRPPWPLEAPISPKKVNLLLPSGA